LRDRFSHFLAVLSDRLQLDVRYFLQGGLWLSLPFLANYLLGMFRSVVLARLTGQVTYGQFGFVNDVAGTLSVLTLPGVNTALTETVVRGNFGSIVDAARARARWGLLSSLAIVGVWLYFLYRGQSDLVVALVVISAFQPLISAFQVVVAYYGGRKRFDLVSLIRVGIMAFGTLALLLALWLQQGVVWLIVANSGVQLLFYLAFYQHVARHTRAAPRDPGMVAYGRALTWANAISSAAFYLDGVVLGFSAGFIDVAVYNIASILPESIKGLMRMLTPLAMPKIAEHPDKQVYTRRTRQYLLYLLAFNLVVVVLAILAIPFVVRLLYGERYAASAQYAQLLMLSLAAGAPSSFFTAALQARKQTRAIYWFNLIYGVLQVSTLIIFVPLWGILGIVISRIVTRWGATLYQWYAVTKI